MTAIEWAMMQTEPDTIDTTKVSRFWNRKKNRLEYRNNGRVIAWVGAAYIEEYGLEAIKSTERLMIVKGHLTDYLDMGY